MFCDILLFSIKKRLDILVEFMIYFCALACLITALDSILFLERKIEKPLHEIVPD
jgi:hypothetical protein